MLSKWDVAYILFTLWFGWAGLCLARAKWFMVCPPNPVGKLRAKWFIADFDMWIGCFTKKSPKEAYWFPFPFIGRKYWREGE